MTPDYQSTRTISSDDERLQGSEYLMYPSPKGGGQIKGLLSTPAGNGKFPGIVVVHENRGLNPYIEDVGRRCAVDGFISLAPDALTPLGGYPGNDDEGRAMQAKRTREEMLEDFIAAYEFLKNHPDCNGKVGVVGFCFGGWISNMMAIRIPDLKAAVPYYGGQPEAAEVAQIKAPLLVIYAELDTRVNAGWPAYEAALKAQGKNYQMINFPGVNHGFHNNTTPRYDEAAAKEAWEKTIAFFRKNIN
jgi:carboxymethylenebutenolidase